MAADNRAVVLRGSGHISRRLRLKFLHAYAEHGNVTKAAASIGYTRQRVNQVRAEDPEFAAACQADYEARTDELEAEALRRALKPHKPSDMLLKALLEWRRYRPERQAPNLPKLPIPEGGVLITAEALQLMPDHVIDALSEAREILDSIPRNAAG